MRVTGQSDVFWLAKVAEVCQSVHEGEERAASQREGRHKACPYRSLGREAESAVCRAARGRGPDLTMRFGLRPRRSGR